MESTEKKSIDWDTPPSPTPRAPWWYREKQEMGLDLKTNSKFTAVVNKDKTGSSLTPVGRKDKDRSGALAYKHPRHCHCARPLAWNLTLLFPRGLSTAPSFLGICPRYLQRRVGAGECHSDSLPRFFSDALHTLLLSTGHTLNPSREAPRSTSLQTPYCRGGNRVQKRSDWSKVTRGQG